MLLSCTLFGEGKEAGLEKLKVAQFFSRVADNFSGASRAFVGFAGLLKVQVPALQHLSCFSGGRVFGGWGQKKLDKWYLSCFREEI